MSSAGLTDRSGGILTRIHVELRNRQVNISDLFATMLEDGQNDMQGTMGVLSSA